MNKKRLSVVMAGAMLASSVAPVLAAEVVKSETSASELGLLIQKVRTILTSEKFADETKADRDRNGNDLAGKSIYEVEVNGVATGLTEKSTQDDYQKKLGNLKVGSKVVIKSKGFVKEGEKYYGRNEGHEEYTAAQVAGLKDTFDTLKAGNLKKVISSVTLDGNGLTVKFAADVNASTLNLKEGSKTIKTNVYLNEYNVETAINSEIAAKDFYGFPTTGNVAYIDIAPSTVEEITITSGGYSLNIDDLYDGLMLTEKGHDFFSMLKEADAMGRNYHVNGNASGTTGEITGHAATAGNSTTRLANVNKIGNAIVKDANGNYVFTVTFPKFKLEGTDSKELPAVTYTITSKDEKNAERLAKWMLKPLARVDILAGDNRYETAVKIAEEYAGLTTVGEQNDLRTKNANIVLVNGNALVDGLAAASLAAVKTNGAKSAPILLTEKDQLPKATKVYLRKLLSNIQIGSLKKVTVHLVGGDAVLSPALEREIRGLGFDVKRYDGDNREETSLKVAEAVEATKSSTAERERFVVGADGEADAMSIAAVAAYNKTPIIVAKRGGISEKALYTFDENANVAVIGGESVVSEAEEKELKSVSKSVIRLGGSNRKATNAKIIETYYKRNLADGNTGFVGEQVGNGKTDHVLVAKDGQRNKEELVDALAAANFASEIKAPIVLATDKLSPAQINALELNSKTSTALYQIGHGVARDVVKSIAYGLGLTN